MLICDGKIMPEPVRLPQIREGFDYRDFPTSEALSAASRRIIGSERSVERDTAIAAWLSDAGAVEVRCASDDLLYVRGAVRELWDWVWEDDDTFTFALVNAYESNRGADRDLHFAVTGTNAGEPHGLVLTARLGGVPARVGWMLASGLLYDDEMMPMRFPRVETFVDTDDWPISNQLHHTMAHRNAKMRIWMRDVVVKATENTRQ